MTEETKQELAPLAEEQEGTALEVYGGREEVRELAQRILKMLPGATELGDSGRLALAQLAVSMGLNPFTGELWAWRNRDGTITLMTGIKGLRRAARNQAEDAGGYYTPPRFRLPTDVEEQGINRKPGDIIIACDIDIWTDQTREQYRLTGKPTYASGLGIVRAGERSMMEHVMLARKRAEADALKQAFDLPLAVGERAPVALHEELVDLAEEEEPEVEVIEPESEETEPERSSVEKDMEDLGWGGKQEELAGLAEKRPTGGST